MPNLEVGGLVFFIKQGIPWKIIEGLSHFTEKRFGCLTVELELNSKKVLISNIYRTPSNSAEHLTGFIGEFEHLLSENANSNQDSYLFMDSNINLMKLNESKMAADFLESAMQNGFIQTVKKVTRICNEKTSLIDEIFTNAKNPQILSGVIISDNSDHFITFIKPAINLKSNLTATISKRNMSGQQVLNFKDAIRNLRRQNVTSCNNVIESYQIFWNDFKTLYDLHFPLIHSKFNRNIHGLNKFMTRGLLISRVRKNLLLKNCAKNRTLENASAYRTYRNLYNSVLRASKKLYYKDQISKNRKNPKKIWELIKEVSTGQKTTQPIEKIKINDTLIEDKQQIAEHFNNFFTKIGQEISDSVPPHCQKTL